MADSCETCGVGLSEADFAPCDHADCPLLKMFDRALERALRAQAVVPFTVPAPAFDAISDALKEALCVIDADDCVETFGRVQAALSLTTALYKGHRIAAGLTTATQESEAISFIRAASEEFINAGYLGGDRTVLLANIRSMLRQITELAKAGSLLRRFVALGCSQAVEDQDWTDIIEETERFLGRAS